ncbi:hypothetical protein SAMN04515672_1686 [Natronorubrum texcoconense]|uniref:Uncharacterized protein n=1 Tax=Natronorubrum texcoconense TaxID=1095776 RepID=A0A1G8XBJ2_9EURY|nr:hypothetical protein SAMN04515672_1686 [Natronorubrum texcoconense]
MTREQEDLKLRFSVGRFEQDLIFFIMIVQVSLVAMACVATLWTVHMTINAYLSPRNETFMYAGWMLYPIGAIVVVYLLNHLYK